MSFEVSSELINKFKHKLIRTPKVIDFNNVSDSLTETGYYRSSNPGLVVDVGGMDILGGDDTVCIDLYTGKFYGGVHKIQSLPKSVQHVFKWYKNRVKGKGDINMSKKEINEAIGEDIQKLASDLTKKREMDKANSSAEDIAKKLGVKLPKSKK